MKFLKYFKVWFKNRRAKYRKKQNPGELNDNSSTSTTKPKNTEYLSQPSSLTNENQFMLISKAYSATGGFIPDNDGQKRSLNLSSSSSVASSSSLEKRERSSKNSLEFGSLKHDQKGQKRTKSESSDVDE